MRQLLPTYDEQPDLLAVYGDGPDTYIRAGFVLSTDGGAVVAGGSRALSGPADRRVFRTLRAVCDVILVGAGTTRAEDYGTIRLSPEGQRWRAERGLSPLPRVAVVSKSQQVDERVFTGGRPFVITCGDGSALAERADVIVAGRDDVDIACGLDQLAAAGCGRILCEGGPSLLAAVLAAGRLDELCLTSAPTLLGPVAGLLPTAPEQSVDLQLRSLLEEDGVLLARYDVRRC